MGIEKTSASLPLGTVQPAAVHSAQPNGGTGFADVLKSSQASPSVNLDSIFEAASEKYGVSLNLLKAVAKAESNFNPKATSSCGAMGIMQLMPGTASGLGVTDLYDPEQNIMGGAAYLSSLLNRFNGDVKLAVAGYNAGPGNVAKYGGVPPFDETENYVRKVLGYLGTDMTAGTVSGVGPGSNTAALDGVSTAGNATGALLKYTLLSGVLGSGDTDSLTGLLGSLGDGSKDPMDQKNLKDTIMTAVYQLQMKMLQGDDDGGGSGFLA